MRTDDGIDLTAEAEIGSCIGLPNVNLVRCFDESVPACSEEARARPRFQEARAVAHSHVRERTSASGDLDERRRGTI